MSILLNGDGVRIEVLKMPNGSVDIYRHGLVRSMDARHSLGGVHRCTDLDENLFHLGPEETKKLMEFLKE